MRKKGSKDNYSMICGTKYKDLFEYKKEKTEGKLFWLATKTLLQLLPFEIVKCIHFQKADLREKMGLE